MKRLLIIDGQNMFIRNYVMSPQLDINGNPIGGLTGFMRSLQKEVRRAKPDRVVFVGKVLAAHKLAGKRTRIINLDAKLPSLIESMSLLHPKQSGKTNTTTSCD